MKQSQKMTIGLGLAAFAAVGMLILAQRYAQLEKPTVELAKSSEIEKTGPASKAFQVSQQTSESARPGVVDTKASQAPAQNTPGYYGSFVGDFYADKLDDTKSPMYMNKINLSIDAVTGNQIRGHSVVAGNFRPFSGTITPQKTGFAVLAKEPGNDPYDGVFEFVLNPQTATIKGFWTANDHKLAVTRRIYQLSKRVFSYNPNLILDAVYFSKRSETARVYNTFNADTSESETLTVDAGKLNASTTLLSAKDVENMYKRDLEVTRNAIYARHGYSFQNRQMRYFFDRVQWYMPVSIDISKELTPIELKNIELLKRYENHAAAYYDQFGR